MFYKDGRGVKRDMAEAASWFRKAAEQGIGIAQLNLGRLYKDGSGVAKDPVEAYVWLSLAARKGYMDALSHRASIAEAMPAADLKAASRVDAQSPPRPDQGEHECGSR